MKGIILAGGTATRLFPLTATTSKQLLPVYNRQMIFYPINTLVKAGIKDILIIVSPEHSGQFLNLLGLIFKDLGIYLEFMIQSVPRGLAEAFILGEEFIDDDNVTLILGDNIIESNILESIENFDKGGLIFTKEVRDPERFGVVEFDKNEKAISIEEKPEKPKSNFISIGVYVYDSRVVEMAKTLKTSSRGELEIVDLHKKYLELDELKVEKLTGEWLDAGTFDSLLEASRIVKEKEIYKKFDPRIDQAIEKFNFDLKKLAKKRLNQSEKHLNRPTEITS
jgi:glucose-1-phosphate thymidylyltransferase